jgi:hypothetical protein
MFIKFFTLGVLLLFSVSCSSSKQNTDEDSSNNDVYVFDEVPVDDSQPSDILPAKEIERNFVIQIGAFSSKQNADKFAEESKIILSEDVNVEFNERINLYVVTLSRIFNSRIAAVNRRDELWRYKEFSDAWLKEVK